MGIVGKTDAIAKRAAKAPATKTGVTLTTKATDEFIERFPIELRLKVLGKATEAAVKLVRKDVQQRLMRYRSRDTGTREKWNWRTREQRAGTDDLVQSIRTKTVQYDDPKHGGTVLSMVGAEKPFGWYWPFLEFGGYSHILWGKKQGGPVPPRPTLRPAAESTKSAQQAVIVSTVKREWESV